MLAGSYDAGILQVPFRKGCAGDCDFGFNRAIARYDGERMAVDRRRYYADAHTLFRREENGDIRIVAQGIESDRMAKRIANALNLYRPKIRRRKSAEKAV